MVTLWLSFALALTAASVPAEPERASAPATTDEIVATAKKLFDDLEYEAVVPLAEQIVASDAVSPQLRLDAYNMLGCSLAIVGRQTEAEQAFRMLLRGRPEFDLPSGETSPKILRVFRNVKVEEERIRRETAALERERLVNSIRIETAPPSRTVGGLPIQFNYRLSDPRGVVETVRLHYRKQGTLEEAQLALARDARGTYAGEVPARFTESEAGFVLEYWLTASNSAGEDLLALPQAPLPPLHVAVAPGTIEGQTPLYEKAWFWMGLGVVAAGAGVGTFFLYRERTAVPDSALGAVRVR